MEPLQPEAALRSQTLHCKSTPGRAHAIRFLFDFLRLLEDSGHDILPPGTQLSRKRNLAHFPGRFCGCQPLDQVRGLDIFQLSFSHSEIVA
jgi:hypothetical protein